MTSVDALEHDIADHARRLDDVESTVSETRKTVVGVDKSLATVAVRLKTLEKLVFAVVIGIGALVGSDIYHNIMNAVQK